LYKFKIADFFDSKQKFVQKKTGDLQPFMRFCNTPSFFIRPGTYQ